MPAPLTTSSTCVQQIWNQRREVAPFFVFARNLVMGIPGKKEENATRKK